MRIARKVGSREFEDAIKAESENKNIFWRCPAFTFVCSAFTFVCLPLEPLIRLIRRETSSLRHLPTIHLPQEKVQEELERHFSHLLGTRFARK